jgi:predicted  nucleic acid-binding Zn-ribbon protein
MPDELLWVLTFFGYITAFATFFIGRKTAAASDGRDQGKMLAEIDYLKKGNDEVRNSVNELKGLIREEQKSHRDDMRRLREDVNDSFRRVHERIDKIEKGCPKSGACRE